MALPADISSAGLAHRTGGPAGPGGAGSVSSVPDTWRRARSRGQSSRGTGGCTRTSAVRCSIVRPGSATARRHSAPLALRTTLRIFPVDCQARSSSANSPGSSSRVSTAMAAASRASVRSGGVARSIRTTRGRT
ncbi:hypothetical protein ACFQQB_07840 [Nonomuraea rubra]|uniref:hypothetical protein n=1 Tax=Nonomuraea rubra TaxID=46180 RepID=UPI0036082B47